MSKYNTAITVRLKPEVYKKLGQVAANCETSKGSIIRQAVSKFLKGYE